MCFAVDAHLLASGLFQCFLALLATLPLLTGSQSWLASSTSILGLLLSLYSLFTRVKSHLGANLCSTALVWAPQPVALWLPELALQIEMTHAVSNPLSLGHARPFEKGILLSTKSNNTHARSPFPLII